MLEQCTKGESLIEIALTAELGRLDGCTRRNILRNFSTSLR